MRPRHPASAAVALLFLAGCSSHSDPAPVDSAAAAAATYSAKPWSPPAKVYTTPVPADFEVTVNELGRKCFGSAGCNVTFSVELKNVGGHDFDPAKTYKIVYTVNGTEDPYSNAVTMTGDQYSRADEEFVQVKDKSAKLTATVTSVVSA
ncbi:hypothetical protein [Dactylosporangium sp. CA-139066]|uniref:hypothetical protein n=1 Tax=Dactylosporangium sp. CA-139066 TaxID=3239930 RepID=UPI003D8F1556